MEITYKSEKKGRQGFRTSFPALKVKIKGYPEKFDVKDFSVRGLAICCGKNHFISEKNYILDLLLGDKIVVKDMRVDLVREIDGGVSAFEFLDLTEHQEERLDKLILEIQKQQIKHRK